MRQRILLSLMGMTLILSACSPWKLLFRKEGLGELKSSAYSVRRINREWNTLPGSEADLAYWSKKTGTIISINSLCRPDRNVPLSTVKQSILGVIEKPKIIDQKEAYLDGRLAAFTTVEGAVDGVPVRVSHIVVNKNFCTYDFMMSSHPSVFEDDLKTFNEFVESFHAE